MITWKTWLSSAVFLVLLVIMAQPTIALDESWVFTPWISHGMGGIEGIDYTNSWEAFFHNYKRNFRIFEVDLTFSRDQQLVANHDWSGYAVPPTHDEFMQSKIKGKFHPMDLHGLIWLLEKFPDISIITDTKETDPKQIRLQFTQLVESVKHHNPALLDRIIPEIYHPEMYRIVNQIHPFKHQIYSTYMLDAKPEEIIDFMQNHGLDVIALSSECVTEDFIHNLREHGISVFVHPINSDKQQQELKNWGVNGIYTDFLHPN
ncbi:MAG TPA: phosphatidylinositol-specific phospholipase C/glycerophosphodiester phosphodiesterase family protein [Bacillota bacterium]|nr:phosphatidylinositol-specific phospholipase C/glycerophosphodiester phosphodiesterase family protein [Bacillota bacterium]